MNQELVPDRSGHFDVDGQKIWWEYFGKGDREAVCLLNGLAMHTKAWYGFLPLLLTSTTSFSTTSSARGSRRRKTSPTSSTSSPATWL